MISPSGTDQLQCTPSGGGQSLVACQGLWLHVLACFLTWQLCVVLGLSLFVGAWQTVQAATTPTHFSQMCFSST